MHGHPGADYCGDLGSSPYLDAQGAQCVSPTTPKWQRSSSTVISTVSRLAVPGSFFEAASFGEKTSGYCLSMVTARDWENVGATGDCHVDTFLHSLLGDSPPASLGCCVCEKGEGLESGGYGQ